MKKHKTESCTQYSAQNLTICSLTADFCAKHKLEKHKPTLFIGGAWDQISRDFAAGILKQFRRTDAIANKLGKATK